MVGMVVQQASRAELRCEVEARSALPSSAEVNWEQPKTERDLSSPTEGQVFLNDKSIIHDICSATMLVAE